MISEVLNRDFVLIQMDAILRELKQRASKRRGGATTGPQDVQVDSGTYVQAAQEVEAALQGETSTSSGPTGFGIPPQRRGGTPETSLDNSCFISSDPIVSIVQSALEEYFDHPESKDRVDEPAEGSQRRGAEVTPPVSDRSIATGLPPSSRRVLDKFSITDPGWVSSLVAMGISKFRSPHPFNPEPAPAHIMGDKCRLIMVGDWGSGLPRAQKVAREMRVFVEDALATGTECHVIHLGDVYYSGFDYEYRKRFLPYWPVKSGEQDRVGSWSLNGNHDMYSGGHAYFGTLLADPRFSRQTRSSYFRLANADWQFIGLDTAYDDNGLKDPQAVWLADNLARNPQPAVLLSHHQFFSAYEDSPSVGEVLREKLGPLLSAGRIFGAIWGHEHRCILHSPHGGLDYARLVGNGGVPVYMTHAADDEYPAPATFEDRRFISTNKVEHWAYMGFAVVDLAGKSLRTRYVDEDGLITHEETIAPGAV
ncbi:metallophosphoesterase [Bradyrhizobium manausense]|uniref:metallophosphoesterase family protein n=1 Tax=Bradyrhizobium manausense TaxID=989370 RepID=UPI001BA7F6E0|nr:metallophosphoesterase [Bradyrhizobium manausense]MBR0684428.1 metallophosphoesterase [Bradyrhizobium manausense]